MLSDKAVERIADVFGDFSSLRIQPFFYEIVAAYAILSGFYFDEDEVNVRIISDKHEENSHNLLTIKLDYSQTPHQLIKQISEGAFEVDDFFEKQLHATIIVTNNLSESATPVAQASESFCFSICKEANQYCIYKPDLYSEVSSDSLENHVLNILKFVTHNPNACFSHLQILSDSETRHLIHEKNNTKSPFLNDKYKSIPEVFERQAAKYPQSMALSCKDKSLTYEALSGQSSILANYLIARFRGKAGSITALYLKRSVESFVCLLGVLKSGRAYLPLHLSFPVDRIQMILEDAAADTLLTQKKFSDFLEPLKGSGINVLYIEDILTQHSLNVDNQHTDITSDETAYIIYTSGTTGKPKGVMVSHRGVINLADHVRKDFGVEHQTKVLQFASIGFDASVYEWAGALLNGAQLFILAEDELPPQNDISDYMRRHGINFTLLPPPILESIDSHNLDTLHTVVSGGEACKKSIVEKWASGRKLFNAYGPSEATVACSFSDVNCGKPITIGKPIQNVKLYVLNKHHRLLPIGVVGELYISGVGLGKGYINRAELNEKVFLPNPFSTDESERMYKTGDRVRWLPSGELEYIERADSQVKLQGYRIELGEIEFVLNSFPDILSSVVIAHHIDEFHKQLIAFYVQSENHEKIDMETLKGFVQSKLPKYMIPVQFIRLSHFPLTSSSKIDHRYLEKIVEERSNNSHQAADPDNLKPFLEHTWRNLLSCDDVSRNFFSLGGDSIRAIQLVAILKKHGYSLTSKALYTYPTIEELTQFLEHSTSTKRTEKKEPKVHGSVPLSPIQNWFFEHDYVKRNQWNQAFLFSSKKTIHGALLKEALDILIKHHDTFRLRYKTESGKTKQIYSENKNCFEFSLNLIDLPKHTTLESSWITQKCIELQNTLDIENGPVVAAAVFKGAHDGEDRVFIAIHHLLIDGVSWRILMEDLLSCYKQLCENKEPSILEKSDSYGDWVNSLLEYSETINDQQSYWEDKLVGMPLVKKRTLIQDQKHLVFNLSNDITNYLLQDLPRHYPLTINDLLLAGLSYSLYKADLKDHCLIDLEGHGREECIDADVTRTIGWFTTIFPVRLNLPEEMDDSSYSDWSELLRNMKEELRGIPDKGIGYGVLRYLSSRSTESEQLGDRSSILFNYLGHFDLIPNESDASWSFAPESPGNPLGTDYFGVENYSRYPLEFNALVVDGSLQFNINYNKFKYSDEKISELAHHYQSALSKFVELGSQLAFDDLYVASELSLEVLSTEHSHQRNYEPFSLVKTSSYRDQIKDIMLIEDVYPASSFQNRMLIEGDNDSNGTYHIVSNFSVKEKLDDRKLKSVIKQLTTRHELLRAAYCRFGEEGYTTLIFKDVDVEFNYYKNEDVRCLIDKEKTNHFNYAKPGLFRIIINECEDNFDIIFSIHNVLEDGWSMANLINEFGDAYLNNTPVLPPLNVKYGEYVRNQLEATRENENVAFWKAYLENAEANKMIWKKDCGVSEDSLFRSFFILESAAVQKIQDVSKNSGITVDIIFLLTYLKTISHFTGSDDITIGLSSNNRLEVEDGDKLFGSFINIIPFRAHLEEKGSEFEKLKDLFKNKIRLQRYKEFPYEFIKRMMDRELYEFVFDFVHMHILNDRAEGIESTFGYERTHLPFMLTVVQKGNESFILSITAHDDFISQAALDEFTNFYHALINDLAEDIWQDITVENESLKVAEG